MANRPGTKQPLERPKIRATVISHMVDGLSDTEVAAALAEKNIVVTRQAITAFRHRHEAEIAPIVAEAERQISDFAIANLVNRVADAQWRRDLLVQVRDARAQGESGVESGIVCTTYKERRHYNHDTGEWESEYVPEYKVDAGFLKEWRENERGVAEVLDQLPRGNLTIDNRTQVLLVRSYDGIDPEQLA